MIVNNENNLTESPLITLRGKPLNVVAETSGPSTPKSTQKRYNTRNSPRRSTPNSPKISRLPVKSARFSVKELRLPPDESVINTGNAVRVTPEKLMEELRVEVKKKLATAKAIDDEIYLSIPHTIEQVTEETEKLSIRPRMSMRNRVPVIVDAPDLVYEDPLEVARQTLVNTRLNTGYKHCKLIYTTERRTVVRASSSEPAFSMKTGITRHFLNLDDEQEDADSNSGKLKFDRVLKLFETEVEDDHLCLSFDLEMKPPKSCLKQKPETNESEEFNPITTQIVQIKRICYAGEVVDTECSKRRRIGGGNGAKRLKKID